MRRRFTLIKLDQARVSHDTVECLRTLLRRAEAGEIIGITYAAMQHNKRFFYSSCGEAHQNPTFAASMIGAAWFGLMREVHKEGS